MNIWLGSSLFKNLKAASFELVCWELPQQKLQKETDVHPVSWNPHESLSIPLYAVQPKAAFLLPIHVRMSRLCWELNSFFLLTYHCCLETQSILFLLGDINTHLSESFPFPMTAHTFGNTPQTDCNIPRRYVWHYTGVAMWIFSFFFCNNRRSNPTLIVFKVCLNI